MPVTMPYASGGYGRATLVICPSVACMQVAAVCANVRNSVWGHGMQRLGLLAQTLLRQHMMSGHLAATGGLPS